MNTLEISALPAADDSERYVVWEGMTPQEVCALRYPGSPLKRLATPIRSLNPKMTYRQAYWVQDPAPNALLLTFMLACLVELP